MTFGFWLALAVAVLGLFFAVLDHGDLVGKLSSAGRGQRSRLFCRLGLLWAIPAVALAATVRSGCEAAQSEREATAYRKEVNEAKGKLADLIPKRRLISPEAEARVMVRLSAAKPVSVGFGVSDTVKDTEELAHRLQGIFSRAGFKWCEFTHGAPQFATPLPSERIPHGVFVFVKEAPEAALRAALEQLVSEIGQEPRISVRPPSVDFVDMEIEVAQP